jgi:hypothetical protein
VSVATTSAPLTASFGSVPHQIFSSHLRSFTRSHTAAGAWYAGFGGVATRRLWPSRGYVTNISCNTLAESPTYAIVNGRSLGRVAVRPFVVGPGGTAEGSKRCTCSCSVRRSARICVGCHSEDSALSTGTGECFASSFEGWNVRMWIYEHFYYRDSAHLNLRVVANSGKNALAHPTDDARCVTRRLAYTQLNVFFP